MLYTNASNLMKPQHACKNPVKLTRASGNGAMQCAWSVAAIEHGDVVLCSGNIRDEPGAVVCRVSASFIRFGTFQLPASREEFHNIPRLADYVIRHHYPQFEGACLQVAMTATACSGQALQYEPTYM